MTESELKKMVRFANRRRLAPRGWRYKLEGHKLTGKDYFAYLDLIDRDDECMEAVVMTTGRSLEEAYARLLAKWAAGEIRDMPFAAGSLEELKLKAAAYGK